MTETRIEWCDRVWNPTTGCDKVSDGCTNCYAMTMAKRLKGMGSAKYQTDGDPKTSGPGFGIAMHQASLDAPLRWRKPQRIFVNSMSDLFHAGVDDVFLGLVWQVMAECPQHTFQILTKRPARMRSFLRPFEPLPNVWLVVSAEDQKRAEQRIPILLDTPAAVRGVSLEPLLGPIDLASRGYLAPDEFGRNGIDWVIVGGESGPGARPMHPHWAEQLHRQCADARVPFLFKQWGSWSPLAPMRDGKFDFSGSHAMTSDGNLYEPGALTYPDGPRYGEAVRADFPHHHPTSMYRVGKKRAGRELYHDGQTYDEYPEAVTAP